MAVAQDAAEVLAAEFAAVFPHLDERQRRLAMGARARSLGHGGITVVARAAGVNAARPQLRLRAPDLQRSVDNPQGASARPAHPG